MQKKLISRHFITTKQGDNFSRALAFAKGDNFLLYIIPNKTPKQGVNFNRALAFAKGDNFLLYIISIIIITIVNI